MGSIGRPPRPVRLVILDLDGTLLATEHAVSRAAADVLAAYGAVLSPEAAAAALGRRPLEAWTAAAESLGDALPERATPERLLRESEERLSEGWKDVAPLPGAKRLVEYLRKVSGERRRKGKNGDRLLLALVTSTPSRTFALKTGPGSQGEAFGRDAWDVVVCGDDVEKGKPHPEGLLLAAARASELLLAKREGEEGEEGISPRIEPRECLVIEDSPAGAAAAVAAGMRCVVVPSFREKQGGSESLFPRVAAGSDEEEEEGEGGLSASGGVVARIPTLFAFDPLPFALPPFDDSIAGGRAWKLDPLLRLEGTVVSGFGRGSAELGIPTANLDGDSLARSLDGSVSGIFAAFARVFFEGEDKKELSRTIFPAVLSVGYNPQFDNGT